MRLIDVYGVKMSVSEQMAFSKHLVNAGVAMNTKTSNERLEYTLNWLADHLGTPKSQVSGLLNRKN